MNNTGRTHFNPGRLTRGRRTAGGSRPSAVAPESHVVYTPDLSVASETCPAKDRYTFFTCVSYAEARNSYSLDVHPSVSSVRLSVRHTLVLYQNG